MRDIILKCEGLSKLYIQGDTTIRAVDNCSISIYSGEFLVIAGASGSGKSTLLHLLSAMDTPTSGKVYIDGRDIYDMNDRELSEFRNQYLGFVFQNFQLLPILTAKENILSPLLIGKKAVSITYFDELVNMLGIADRIHHLPNELSGGQQQRVAVARALINKPKILFADEPTGNLDKKSSGELIELIQKIREETGQTIVMVTHDMNLAKLADRVLLMEDGVIKQTTI